MSNIWLLAARDADKVFGNAANVAPKIWAYTQLSMMQTYIDTPIIWLFVAIWGYLFLALSCLIESIAKNVLEKAERGT
jgi:hypothetical protein